MNENREQWARITRISIVYGAPSDVDSLRRHRKLTSSASFVGFFRLKRFKVKIFRLVLVDVGAVTGFELVDCKIGSEGDRRRVPRRIGNDWVVVVESSMESEVELEFLRKVGIGGAFLVGASSFGVKLNGDLWCDDDIMGVGVWGIEAYHPSSGSMKELSVDCGLEAGVASQWPVGEISTTVAYPSEKRSTRGDLKVRRLSIAGEAEEEEDVE